MRKWYYCRARERTIQRENSCSEKEKIQ